MEGAELGGDGNGGRRFGEPIWPGDGSNGLGDGRWRWRARLVGLGREEIERSGEVWPVRRATAALLKLGSA